MLKKIVVFLSVTLMYTTTFAQKSAEDYPKAYVNYDAFEHLVKTVKSHRAQRLVSLKQFLEKSKEINTIILDTRSKAMYDYKHIKGAVHLDFSDFTQQALDSIMNTYSGTKTQILIYCNNNFTDKKKLNLQDPAFVTKMPRPSIPEKLLKPNQQLTLALNIPTYINLYGYGYTNVYELSELVDVNDSRIKFEGNYLQYIHLMDN